jgi:hypothetical protein
MSNNRRYPNKCSRCTLCDKMEIHDSGIVSLYKNTDDNGNPINLWFCCHLHLNAYNHDNNINAISPETTRAIFDSVYGKNRRSFNRSNYRNSKRSNDDSSDQNQS